MKYVLMLISLICIQISIAQNENQNLNGKWNIDLRPTQDAAAYYQILEVTKVEGSTLEGTFYGSPIENAILNSKWEKLYFAFMTKDQSNTYYHSGYLLDGKIFGITYCPTRTFTAPWKGVKQQTKK